MKNGILQSEHGVERCLRSIPNVTSQREGMILRFHFNLPIKTHKTALAGWVGGFEDESEVLSASRGQQRRGVPLTLVVIR